MIFFKIPHWTTALSNNTTGSNNTALGVLADVSAGNLTNATAIGANAVVDASNKIRLGNYAVTEVETAGYMKGLTGLCIGTDCKTAWPAGTVTGVTTSAPLASSGGTAPNIISPTKGNNWSATMAITATFQGEREKN
ncbi:MAG: hypothetical protein HYY46_12495 [Deltaproteobacteria bacterium]|nr:hypothetical protein [Deltaproteobacteria bacterium]